MNVMPETRLGKWAAILAAVFVFGFIISFVAAQMFYNALGMFSVAVVMVMDGAGVAALILSLISIIKKHERSFVVFLSLAVGLYALAFLVFLAWLTISSGSQYNINAL
jgi:hypothetical protein